MPATSTLLPRHQDAAVEAEARPVFVDDLGRRARRLRWAGRVLAALVVAYLGLLAASLVGASWVPRTGLPGVSTVIAGPSPRAAPQLGPEAVTNGPVTSPPVKSRPGTQGPLTGARVNSPAATGAAVPASSARQAPVSTAPASPPTTAGTPASQRPTASTLPTGASSPSSSTGASSPSASTTTTTQNHGQQVSSQHSHAITH